MSLGPVDKIALVSSGIVGTVTTTLSSYHLFRDPITIGEALQSQGFKLLEDEEKWTKLTKKHRKEKTNPKIKRIQGLELTKDQDNPRQRQRQRQRQTTFKRKVQKSLRYKNICDYWKWSWKIERRVKKLMCW